MGSCKSLMPHAQPVCPAVRQAAVLMQVLSPFVPQVPVFQTKKADKGQPRQIDLMLERLKQ